MNEKDLIKNFPITTYGKLTKFNDVISKGRCRIFYKGSNRNGSYITDEFAEKLIATVPYTPVKGIYTEDIGDYEDHGEKRTEGRIYGVVPAEPNFAWEKHLDPDGVEREYACVDVLYYTGLYPEAGQIDGKSESMELYGPSLKGSWQVIDNKKQYVFTEGCFLGLQILGEDVEPCFEGAAFFSLYESLKSIMNLLEQKNFNIQNNDSGGQKVMPQLNFKISDCQKHEFLWSLLNTNYNEENGWIIEYAICEIYDEYAIVRNYAEQCFERVYYTKNDETDSLSITNKEKCFIVDVNEAEKAALAAIQAVNGGTYENLDTKFGLVTDFEEKISELDAKITEFTNEIATLKTEKEEIEGQCSAATEAAASAKTEFENQISALNETIETLTTERDTLASYKKNVEDEAKKAVINSYADVVPAEVIESYMNALDNYTCEDLDMRLTYAQKQHNPATFNNQSQTPAPAYVPKDNKIDEGWTSILSKYEK